MKALLNKRSVLFILLLLLIAGRFLSPLLAPDSTPPSTGEQEAISRLYADRQSNVQVTGSGTVVKILADDLKGSRHQKMIVRVSSDQTVLIAHNIDLAPRVAGLREGDRIQFHGEYEWNDKGGVIHWTHKDPRQQHQDGWLKHEGRIYQ